METARRESPLEISVEGEGTENRRRGVDHSMETVRSEYDPESNTHRVYPDGPGSTVRPSTAVVEVVAALAGKDSTQLDPLYTKIDPDALDVLAGPTASDTEHDDVVISFSFEEYQVTVKTT